MIDLRFNYPVLDSQHTLLQTALATMPPLKDYLCMEPPGGHFVDKQIAAQWLSRTGISIAPQTVAICCGGHHALTVICLAANLSGQSVIVDPLTYNGFIGIASLLNITLIPCPIDNEGMEPDALAKLCENPAVKAIYLTPTIHNPLAFIMPLTRRQEIVAVARQADKLLIDDDAYGFLDPHAPASFAHLAPERGFFIYSLAKPVAPGVKTAYMLVPPQWQQAVANTVRVTSSGSVTLLTKLVSHWITTGVVRDLIDQKRQQAIQKQELVKRIFNGVTYTTQPTSYHIWFPLPASADPQQVGEELLAKGVDVVTSQGYQVGPVPSHKGIRVALGNVTDEQVLEKGLRLVANTLALAATGPHRE